MPLDLFLSFRRLLLSTIQPPQNASPAKPLRTSYGLELCCPMAGADFRLSSAACGKRRLELGVARQVYCVCWTAQRASLGQRLPAPCPRGEQHPTWHLAVDSPAAVAAPPVMLFFSFTHCSRVAHSHCCVHRGSPSPRTTLSTSAMATSRMSCG